jgi:subtilisin family serine protease
LKKEVVKRLESLDAFLSTILSRRQFVKASLMLFTALGVADRLYAQPTPPSTIGPEPITVLPPGSITPLKLAFDLSRFPLTLTHESGGKLVLDNTRLLASFAQPQSFSDVQAILNTANSALNQQLFVLEDTPVDHTCSNLPPLAAKVNHAPYRFWLRSRCGSAIDQSMVNLLESTAGSQSRQLDWVSPAYRFQNSTGRNGTLTALANVLIVKPTPHAKDHIEDLDNALVQFHLAPAKNIFAYSNMRYRYYKLQFPAQPAPNQKSVFELRSTLTQQFANLIQETRFDYMPLISPLASAPSDRLYSQQWNLEPTQFSVKALAGWNSLLQGPGQNVVVAVIDQGCYLEHPDLLGAFSTPPGASFDYNSSSGLVMDDGLASPTESHGTKVAGIIAARYNSKGIAGLAGQCRIMPLKIVNWQPSEVADAIDYAAKNGAKVINMSFGGSQATGDYLNDSAVNAAIEASFLGENVANNRVVICAATHNRGEQKLYYPAAHRRVMACGASNKDGERASEEPIWGSNFGNGMSVVAPGIEIPTTSNRLTGDDTLNSTDSEYKLYSLHFERTSAAVAHVAALAALLIGKCASLGSDPQEVRNIIERTAYKLPSYKFTDTPLYADGVTPMSPVNGGWDLQVGYGLIDVTAALATLCPNSPPVPPTNLQVH